MAGRRKRGGSIVGALDIGSSKIACLIFEMPGQRRGETGLPRILGFGHQRSHGLKAGVITETDAAEGAIRAAVAQAERNAGVTLRDVYVAITCGRLASLSFAATAQTSGGVVRDGDIDRLNDGARAYAERDGRVLVHMNRKAFRLDGAVGGDQPRGMAADKLSADMHAVTADAGTVANVVHVVERCHLAVAGLIAAPYASAMSVTSEEEQRLGVTVVDLGGGTTTWAAFGEGQFLNCGVFATGGHHLTFDIAQKLRAPLVEAERIKTLYASMVNAKSDVSDRFSYSPANRADGGLQELTRAQLCDVVRPRVDVLLQSVAAGIRAAGVSSGQIVLTGGASQLVGLAQAAQGVFDAPVRLGRPQALPGLATGADSPAFAATIGLMGVVPVAWLTAHGGDGDAGRGFLSRVGRWIGSGF